MNHTHKPIKMAAWFTNAVLAILSALLAIIAVLSLSWRMVHDPPIFLYLTYLMDHFKLVPYRDFIEVNMPGVYFIYLPIVRIFGYGDVGFRYADLIYLCLILTFTYLFMKRLFGQKPAWLSVVLFGLVYLEGGPMLSMQRDYLLILPIALALLAASRPLNLGHNTSYFVTGLLFGLSATIKPQAVLGFPCVLAFQIAEARADADKAQGEKPSLLKALLLSASGIAIPSLTVLIYLYIAGGLESFFDLAWNYWPLFNEIPGDFRVIPHSGRINYLIQGYLHFGGNALWLAPAIFGFYVALSNGRKRQTFLLAGLAVMYSFYPIPAGKFWVYHWLPFYYFIVLSSSLCLMKLNYALSRTRAVVSVAVLLLTVFLFLPRIAFLYGLLMGASPGPPKGGRVDKIAVFLKARLRPGDTVQPLDWTGGAVHAMLIAKARLATPFVHDVEFYHNVSNCYIKGLRRRFIEDLIRSKPRFIVQIETDKPWVSGMDTTRNFDELQKILDTSYKRVVIGDSGYIIYEAVGRFSK